MSAAKCPICGQPATAENRPFCSTRCADLDLHRWLSGGYSVPGEADGENPDGLPRETACDPDEES
ncbi:MAG: DNA gyrase inhibitor YacG [Proteobacteria bacterium]|nr:DNA gyrase inhibitor YacG [Pseudomonadota bacterium]